MKSGMKRRRIAFLLCFLVLFSFMQPRSAESTCGKKEGVEDHVLLFCSDVHEKTDSNLKTMLNRLKETEVNLEYICYGGDYAKEFSQKAIKKTYKTSNKYFPKTKILMTTGNHDRIGYDGKKFSESAKVKGPRVCVEEPGYCIYMFGASAKEQAFTDQDLADLKQFLEERKSVIPKVPTFIVSHYPIHYYKGEKGERVTKQARKLVELLNGYQNVIFLYGHNHTLEDENYMVINMPGDDLQIDKDLYIGIHFPYTSMGAVKDGAGKDVYGLKITFEHTMCCNKVIFEHINLYAEPKDRMMICFPVVES